MHINLILEDYMNNIDGSLILVYIYNYKKKKLEQYINILK